ncbi:MAG: xanthine dehydrogenase family protein subunit M [Anaerolineae bacterium]|nr:xanthine dehydrogenase family protein subunit M [Anaerolineae bacterium]
MQAFEYVAPRSLDEATHVLAHVGAEARCLGGGTDLIAQMREGRRSARVVVDIKRIPELDALKFDPIHGLTLGAAVPCSRIHSHGAVAAAFPGLIDAVSLIGGIAIQNRASLGGNICTASPAGDSLPALLVHNAHVLLASAQGTRRLPLSAFFVGPGKTVLRPDELVVQIELPAPPAGFGAAYLRFTPRNEMDIAVVGVGAAVVLENGLITQARVALGAVAPTPILVPEAAEALVGKAPSPEVFADAAAAAQRAAQPITDMRGTAEQRRHLVGVLTRRALQRAVERARVSQLPQPTAQ